MRESGILLAISSLPSRYGIGCFSKEAYQFVDFLKRAGQTYWQILPIGQTGYGDSPYQSFSTFAGNPYFIDLEKLIDLGYLSKEDCDRADLGISETCVDYEKQFYNRFQLLFKAYENADICNSDKVIEFREKNKSWLEDYALYMAVKKSYNHRSWEFWDDDIRLREKAAMDRYKEELKKDVDFYVFLQYMFYLQWSELKHYANSNGIQIIGDIPIYVAFDSADAWANPELFEFDETVKPINVAGCPPDGFSADGQLWGNPLYRWDYHKKTGYEWWIKRVESCYHLYDVIRIDHFRGFDEYYSIPYGEKTAKNGCWVKGPGIELFDHIKKALGNDMKVIAEDLGFITDSVRQLVEDSGFPDMKVLEFGFDSREDSDYLPHNYEKNSVVYTGTHDNDTVVGWFDTLPESDKQLAKDYLSIGETDILTDKELAEKFVRLAMLSTSNMCIIPMQDYLGLGSEARMNTPSTLGGNWQWRMTTDQISDELADSIYKLTEISFRNRVTDTVEIMEAKMTLTNQQYYDTLEEQLSKIVNDRFGKTISACTDKEVYLAVLALVKEMLNNTDKICGKKKVYYISAEFLIGKLLSNNLINLGIYEKLEDILAQNGKSLAAIEEVEPEPSLGNGGLGRLAACFLDSIATLGLPGDGIGLNYHLGLFKQVFKDRKQTAVKNEWIEPESWLNKENVSFEVKFGDFSVTSNLYDIDVVGYNNGINKLHLFDIDTIDESIVDSGISFDKEDIKKNLTLFLYPDDSDEAGNLLRIYQQYFMVSNGAQLILKELGERNVDLRNMDQYCVIQINDTHPTMVIPELIRILVEDKAFTMDEAIEVVSKTCAYTNHTILAEALEKWPLKYLEKVVPQLVPIIKELDKRVKAKYSDEKVQIIDKDGRVHMAHIDIHYGFSVNGVAAIHTEILKDSELNAFYKIYPEKFNNKTNGITFRRWLLSCNRPLADLITRTIGEGYKKDAAELEKLLTHLDDKAVLDELAAIKHRKKVELCDYLKVHENEEINPDSIFDIQVKRLHEYKRQQMNALYIIHKYLEIKSGKKPAKPVTFIFGAKAAPAYVIAQDIIHLLLCLQKVVNNDPAVNQYMKVVMVENYNVSYAEKLIPACDISEQISLASKEASGTGNMKFMLNGAVTLGTSDGANVEIDELVGSDNIYIFGEKSENVIKYYDEASYVPKKYYENSTVIKEAVDFIISEELIKVGDKENLTRLYNELLNKDWFMTLLDLEDYIRVKDQALTDYADQESWKKKMLVNIAKAGFFSSDRTIEQYNQEIWKLTF